MLIVRSVEFLIVILVLVIFLKGTLLLAAKRRKRKLEQFQMATKKRIEWK